ncbi:MAG TPA: hypothetical protein VEA16_19405, partial [Vicinamibacterales bacterium]|nr:hypothetical protein [Vicinamibacterales bacterium]
LGNEMNAWSRGVESMTAVQVTSRWQVHASHLYHWKEFTFDPGSSDPTRRVSEANDPRHIFKLRSYLIVTNRVEVDAFLRHFGSRPQPAVAAYTELDARLGYRVRPGWDLSLIGTNLLHDRHLEFRSSAPPETYERTVSLRSTWRF